MRRFTHYVAHTEPTARHLMAMGLPRERITVLAHPPLGLAATPLPVAAAHPGSAGTRILLFGALKAYKGVDLLVRAGIELARRRQDFTIVIAGQPFMAMDQLRAEIDKAGAGDRFVLDLRFLPEAELGAQLAAADLVVFPYREIDASGALALAAGLGKPILASSVGVFAEPPAAGLIGAVPPNDVPALTSALEMLVADPQARARLAEGSRRLAAALPGWPAFAASCLELYRRLPTPG
jgi:glycosyltransferase involved in cell wall biosynthesis